jgi:hypothetical protein
MSDKLPTSKSSASKKRKRESPPTPRRTEADLRNEHLKQGAILLKFTVTRNPPPNQADIQNWRCIEKKGFRVALDGCLIPHSVHWFKNRQKKIASDVALTFFHGKKCDRTKKVNKHGWPCQETTSHLCHWNICCAYNQLCIEPQWMNVKRNYCGRDGVCDCGMKPPCVDTYHNSTFDRQKEYFSYSTPDLSKKIKQLFEVNTSELKISVKILPADFYKKQDLKRSNRIARKKGGDRAAAQSKKKRQRIK